MLKRVILFSSLLLLSACAEPVAIGLEMELAQPDADTLVSDSQPEAAVPDSDAATGTFVFSSGTEQADRATAIAPLPSGGYLAGGVTFGSFEFSVSSGGADMFIAAYTADNTLLWRTQIGSAGEDILTAIMYDGNASIYAVGYTTGTLGAASLGNTDMLVVKCDLDGTVLWKQQLGGNGNDYAMSVAKLGSYLFIAGSFTGTFANGHEAKKQDALLLKLDSNGKLIDTLVISSKENDWATAVFAGSNGAIYLAGNTDGSLYTNTNAGMTDIFLMQTESTLLPGWLRQIGTHTPDIVYGGSVSGDNIVLAGMTYGAFAQNINMGSYDALLVAFDKNGNPRFYKQHGTDGLDVFYTAVYLPSGDIYAAGTSAGALFSQTSAGSYDAIIAHYSSNGGVLDTLQTGFSGDDVWYASAADSNTVFFAGTVSGSISHNTDQPVNDYMVMTIQ